MRKRVDLGDSEVPKSCMFKKKRPTCPNRLPFRVSDNVNHQPLKMLGYSALIQLSWRLQCSQMEAGSPSLTGRNTSNVGFSPVCIPLVPRNNVLLCI